MKNIISILLLYLPLVIVAQNSLEKSRIGLTQDQTQYVKDVSIRIAIRLR